MYDFDADCRAIISTMEEMGYGALEGKRRVSTSSPTYDPFTNIVNNLLYVCERGGLRNELSSGIVRMVMDREIDEMRELIRPFLKNT